MTGWNQGKPWGYLTFSSGGFERFWALNRETLNPIDCFIVRMIPNPSPPLLPVSLSPSLTLPLTSHQFQFGVRFHLSRKIKLLNTHQVPVTANEIMKNFKNQSGIKGSYNSDPLPWKRKSTTKWNDKEGVITRLQKKKGKLSKPLRRPLNLWLFFFFFKLIS